MVAKVLCPHGVMLPKSLKCDHGYIQIRLRHAGRMICENFGTHDKESQQVAELRLAQIRTEILRGRIGITPELPEKTVGALYPVFFKHWSEEKDGDGRLVHNPESIRGCQLCFERKLLPFFGNMKFNRVRSTDVEKWREKRLLTGVSGTSVNREQVPLSSFFSLIIKLIRLERIEAIKIPDVNPCLAVDKAKTKVRQRIPTVYELKKLKLAFNTVGDAPGWEICKLALKTVLSAKDLRKLEIGQTIDTERSKSGVAVHLPINVLSKFDFTNWRKRWEKARSEAGLSDLQFRDLRKCGGNRLLGKHDMKLVSQYMGHASVKTTEGSYMLLQQEKMKPLADDLETWVEEL